MDARSQTLQCLRFLIRPIVKYCLKNSLTIQDLTEMAKAAFVDSTVEALENNNQKVNVSRISVRSGIRRREVIRFYKDQKIKSAPTSLLTKVIGRWTQDPRFLTKARKPLVLDFESDQSKFHTLVRTISHDVSPGTLLSELLGKKLITKTKQGIKLKKAAYVAADKPVEGYQFLSQDVEDLTFAADENILQKSEVPNLHATTEYDNIPENKIEEVKTWLLKEGSAFHQKVAKYVSGFDCDLNQINSELNTVRVAFGSFSRVERLSHD